MQDLRVVDLLKAIEKIKTIATGIFRAFLAGSCGILVVSVAHALPLYDCEYSSFLTLGGKTAKEKNSLSLILSHPCCFPLGISVWRKDKRVQEEPISLTSSGVSDGASLDSLEGKLEAYGNVSQVLFAFQSEWTPTEVQLTHSGSLSLSPHSPCLKYTQFK